MVTGHGLKTVEALGRPQVAAQISPTIEAFEDAYAAASSADRVKGLAR
jgi:hypothetical protein